MKITIEHHISDVIHRERMRLTWRWVLGMLAVSIGIMVVLVPPNVADGESGIRDVLTTALVWSVGIYLLMGAAHMVGSSLFSARTRQRFPE